MSTPEGYRRRTTLEGVVVSNKMDKTIVVRTTRRLLHPVYKKFVTRHDKYKAHDEQNTCNVGDVVRIQETRPLSKEKRWRLKDIVERAEG
jgi:small subunit ribosomal protein S17